MTFDLSLLRTALDTQRSARGMTWAAVGRELGVSGSTLSGLGSRPVAEGDGVLRAVAWLGRTPESFAPGRAVADPIPVAPLRALRFDSRAIHGALEAARVSRGLTWAAVANACGVRTPASLTRLRHGGRVMFPEVMRVFDWLDAPAARFVRIVRP